MALNDNTMNKQDTQKRILLAILLSFAFFIAYDFLYLQPQQLQAQQAAKIKELEKKTATMDSTTHLNKMDVVLPINQKQNVQYQTPINLTVSHNRVLSTITTKKSIIKIDDLGRILQVTLLGKQYTNEDGSKIKLFTKNQLKPLEVRFANRQLNDESFKVAYETSNVLIDARANVATLNLIQHLSTVTVTKIIKFYPDGHYDIDISVSNNEPFFITPGFRPDVLADMYADHGALLILDNGTLNIVEDGDLDKTTDFAGVSAASSFDRYYATLLYNMDTKMKVSVMPDNNNNPQIFIHGHKKLILHGYLGPKEYKVLTSLHPKLSQVIEYGWFTFIAKPMFLMLQFIHDYIGNWGWTIVLITILIKITLYPLAYKGMVSMNRLKELSPKIKQIQEKYKDDKQKASMHMMELYKKEGANPMGGCLPIILQIPVFFAIYRVLLNAIELKGAPWILWIEDLALMDPYYVLPILMGITMFVQQKITPNQMQDEMQKKIFMMLPIIFTFFFLWFPAGLTLYWFVNNLFTVAQQYYVNNIFDKAKTMRHNKHLEEKKHTSK